MADKPEYTVSLLKFAKVARFACSLFLGIILNLKPAPHFGPCWFNRGFVDEEFRIGEFRV